MAALNLHHAIFTNEKTSDLPLRSASSFLHPAPENDGSPTSHLFASPAYQDLIQRQPTHPDGPMSGWDLGLNLLGDPMTGSEHKSLEDYQTKMKLRRLRAMNITFELLFGIWGTYTTVRYFLAFVDSPGHTEHICALVLGVTSAFVVVLVIISIMSPLFPRQSHPHAWRHTRSLLRACYLLLLSAGAMTNLVLVLIWHPSQLCGWDIDISWYTSPANTITSPCDPAPSATWIAAAILRLVVTCAIALSFIYTLRSYHKIRHPTSEWGSPKYSPYLPSDPEGVSPVSTSSPHHLLKSTLWLIRSDDSDHTLSHSNITLPKSNSISTLAPSTYCTGHSRSHSTPPPKDISPPKVSPPTSRRPSTHVTSHAPSTQFRSETPSHTQPANDVTGSSSTPHMLRRTSRISVAKETSDAMPPNTSSYPERLDGQTTTRDPSEIRSGPSWRPGHRGTGMPDIRKASLAWENTSAQHVSHSSVGSASTAHDDSGGCIPEKDKVGDDLVYAYGYGACGPTYPYLDMYNPQTRPGGYVETASSSSCEDVDEHGVLQAHRSGRAIPPGPAFPDASSGPSSHTVEEAEDGEDGASSVGEPEGEEYVAMMGGFVRRMATIESLGSKEAAATATTTGSVARHSSVRSKTPGSQFSSVCFAEYGSSCASSRLNSWQDGSSFGTTYLSFSSGGTGMCVNERGELMPGPNAHRGTAGSPQYYTASGSSFPRTDEDR